MQEASKEDLRKLWITLNQSKDFVKGKNLNMNSRIVRKCVQAHPEHFLSTNQGFKLVKHASLEQLERAINDHHSRAQALLSKARCWQIQAEKTFYK